jgi:hypothetical protein
MLRDAQQIKELEAVELMFTEIPSIVAPELICGIHWLV